MAAVKKKPMKSLPPNHARAETPAAQTESEIHEEIGAKPDETGDVVVDQEVAREVGAVDAQSVQANRRREDALGKKRANVKNVSFSTDDLLEKYDFVLSQYPANTIDIHVLRRTGTPASYVITSRPASGTKLYEAMMRVHGINEEIDYDVKFQDVNNKQYRGTGRITLPNTKPPEQQMNHPYYPPQQPQYQGYAPGYGGQQPPPAPAAAPAPPPQVVQVHAPPPQVPDVQAMAVMMDVFERMRHMFQPPTPPQPVPVPQQAPPPPPAGADPTTMMNWMLDMAQRLQSGQPVQAPQPTQVAPVPQGLPPGAVSIDTLTQVIQLVQSLQAPQQRAGYAPARGPMYDRTGGGELPPRRTYQEDPYSGRYRDRAPEPTPEPSFIERGRNTMREMTEIVSLADQIRGVVPGLRRQEEQEEEAPQEFDANDEDSDVRVMKAGDANVVIGKRDGKMKWGETVIANLPKIMGALGETVEKVSANQQRNRQQQMPKLPPGFVQVGPGYRPPPGFTAVIESQPSYPQQPQSQPPPSVPMQYAQQEEESLPPPPEDVPPPVQQPGRWGGMPNIEDLS